MAQIHTIWYLKRAIIQHNSISSDMLQQYSSLEIGADCTIFSKRNIHFPADFPGASGSRTLTAGLFSFAKLCEYSFRDECMRLDPTIHDT